MRNSKSIPALFLRVVTRVFKKNQPTYPPFLQVMRQYISKEITENSLKESTIKKYEGFLQNIETFFKLRRLSGITAMEVKIKHMEDLKLYLHQNLSQCSLTHSARHLELCKRSLKYAVQADLIPYNTLESMETKRDPIKEVLCLEQVEFIKLVKYQFASEIMNTVKHLYIFQALTGLSYADLWSYNVTTDKKGKNWLQGRRLKSGIEYHVPFHPIAEQIHNYYQGKLPEITNAAYNRVLKEVAHLAGISKPLTTHTGRKTFATLNYENGWSLEGLRIMMGQSSIKTGEKHYVKPSRKRVEKEMEGLRPLQLA